MEYGVDTSYANGSVNWAAARACGLSFAYQRASYGTNPSDDDPNFAFNHDSAKAVGLLTGAYFFFLAQEDPHAQTAHFISRIDGRQGDLRPCIDVEEGSFPSGWSTTPRMNIMLLDAASKMLQDVFKVPPVIYTNQDTWATYFENTDGFAGHPLWVASYGAPQGQPAMPGGWKAWAIHQYSKTGTMDGTNGNIDLDCSLDLTPVKL